ncbi:MAG: hypothetical protein MJ072_06450, partial [Clostridia bacterium]|nr:hypothetical protein [Clostridia bacterium]
MANLFNLLTEGAEEHPEIATENGFSWATVWDNVIELITSVGGRLLFAIVVFVLGLIIVKLIMK